MKKILFSGVAIFIAGACFGQHATVVRNPISFGIKIGPNFTNYAEKDYGYRNFVKMITRFEGGAYANIHLKKKFYLQPSVMFIEKGGWIKYSTYKTKLSYLELPVDFLFISDTGHKNKFIAGLGPYLACGVGNYPLREVVPDPALTRDLFWNGPLPSKPFLNRVDAGINGQLGYEIGMGLNIGVNADLGLVNMMADRTNNNSFRNFSFAITAGYTLHRK